MVMHFSGRIADSFDREFRCLYADSQIIECFSNPEEEGLPFYPPFHAMMAPGLTMGFGPMVGLDVVSDRCVALVLQVAPPSAAGSALCCSHLTCVYLLQAEAEL